METVAMGRLGGRAPERGEMDLTHDRISKPRASQQVFSHFHVKAGHKVGADAIPEQRARVREHDWLRLDRTDDGAADAALGIV